jgi:hypothetical protein
MSKRSLSLTFAGGIFLFLFLFSALPRSIRLQRYNRMTANNLSGHATPFEKASLVAGILLLAVGTAMARYDRKHT